MAEGNIVEYLRRSPSTNRLQLVSRWWSLVCVGLNIGLCEQISEIASGLAYLHSVPVVHGDLRGVSSSSASNHIPNVGYLQQNILIDSNSRPHIADFGLSRILNEHLLLDMAQQSFRWLAPELMDDGELRVTPASDVYAFACTCYEVSYASLLIYSFVIKSDFQIIDIHRRSPLLPYLV
jgi:serine/threonine protein kinase